MKIPFLKQFGHYKSIDNFLQVHFVVKCKSTIIHKYHQRLFLNLLKSKDINYHTVRLIDHHYNFYNFVIAGFDVWLWVDLCQVTGMSSYQRLHCNNSLLNPTQTEDMTPHHWRILCLPLIKRFPRALRLDLISVKFNNQILYEPIDKVFS